MLGQMFPMSACQGNPRLWSGYWDSNPITTAWKAEDVTRTLTRVIRFMDITPFDNRSQQLYHKN